jgi:hypothetical protein
MLAEGPVGANKEGPMHPVSVEHRAAARSRGTPAGSLASAR